MANEVLEHTPDHRDRGLIRTYSCVAESFLRGIVRLYQARIVFKGHEAFLIGLHTKQVDLSGIGDEAKRLLDMCRVSYAEYDSYSYLVEASMFVYGTTLFDTFLSDTTRFLYLANLDQLAEKGVQVPLREVVAKSRAAIINETVSAKSRKLAFRPFSQRIETLDKRFRLKLTIPDATRRTLEHFSSIRNSFIHDQAVYDVTMNEDGEVQARRKTCPLHPTPLGVDFRAGLGAYFEVAGLIHHTVIRSLGGEADPNYFQMKEKFDGLVAGLGPVEDAQAAKPPGSSY